MIRHSLKQPSSRNAPFFQVLSLKPIEVPKPHAKSRADASTGHLRHSHHIRLKKSVSLGVEGKVPEEQSSKPNPIRSFRRKQLVGRKFTLEETHKGGK